MMHFQCALCGESIEVSESDPVYVTIALDDGGKQQLYAHYKCLKAAIHPSVPLYIFEQQS